eukprot:TRINITY_DN2794_c1_g1_i7.p1 TRINITY_DN2794_c1_g1~~TRINITY_DN2794_c1_g1_i7.p1  ORF type:complete len:649 (+),score=132.96 TRINITY_DN2794_c1_g1_i7:89-2035(+)
MRDFPVGHPYMNGQHLRILVPLPRKYNVDKQTDDEFHECVKELREWKDSFRVSYIPQTVHDRPLLGIWLAAMRRSFKFTKWRKYIRGRRKKVRQERMKKLSLPDWKWEVVDRVGVDWKIGQPDSFWWHHFHNARRFYSVYGHLNIPRFSRMSWDIQWQGIRKWIPKVQKHYYQGKLSPVRAASCRDIGIKLPKRVHPIQQRVKEQLRRELGIYSVDEETKDWEEFEQLRKQRLKDQADRLKRKDLEDAERRRPRVVNKIQELQFDDLDVIPMGGLTVMQQRQNDDERRRRDRLGLDSSDSSLGRKIETRHANTWDFGEEEDDGDIIDLEILEEEDEEEEEEQGEDGENTYDPNKEELFDGTKQETSYLAIGSQYNSSKLPLEQGESQNTSHLSLMNGQTMVIPELDEFGDIDVGLLIRERGSPFRENIQDAQDVELLNQDDDDENEKDALDDIMPEAQAVVGYVLPTKPDWYGRRELDEDEYFEKVMDQREIPRIQSIEVIQDQMKQTVKQFLDKASSDSTLDHLQRSVLYRQALATYLTYRAVPVSYWFDWWKLLLPVVAHDWDLVESTFDKVLKGREVMKFEWVDDLMKAVQLLESMEDNSNNNNNNQPKPSKKKTFKKHPGQDQKGPRKGNKTRNFRKSDAMEHV